MMEFVKNKSACFMFQQIAIDVDNLIYKKRFSSKVTNCCRIFKRERTKVKHVEKSHCKREKGE